MTRESPHLDQALKYAEHVAVFPLKPAWHQDPAARITRRARGHHR